MALDVRIYTAHKLPSREESKIITEPFHKALHALIEELPSQIAAHQTTLKLGKHREVDDIHVKLIEVHHWSKMPDLEVLIECKFKGGGDQNHKSSSKEFRKIVKTILEECGGESLTIEAKIHRGSTTLHNL